jgi:rod shape-determining protein MreC
VTIDVGSNDGIQRDMTVLNGDGLVGRVTTVGPDTATVLLANDPDFTVGTRMESSDELGFASGQGDRPLRVEMLNGKAKIKKGDRLVTFGSQADKPFVPGVPVGVVSRVDPSGGDLTRTIYVTPYVSFSKLDIVGVVVEAPRKDPRDTVLPAKPKPTPTPTVTVTVTPSASEPVTGQTP